MPVRAPVTVEDSGLCRVYVPRELFESTRCLAKTSSGWYTTYWYDLPELAQHCHLVFSPESNAELQRLRRERKAAVAAKAVPAAGISELFTESKQPRPFQLKAMNFALHTRSALVADDVGLGKTIDAIGVLLEAFRREDIDRAVIVVPSTLRYQWRREIADCNAYLPDIWDQIVVVDGDKKTRERQYARRAAFTLIHYQLLLRDAKSIARLVNAGPLAVVADECSSPSAIKNRSSKTSRVFKRLFRDATYKLALTATPIENRLSDLYSIVEWFNPRAFGTVARFTDRFLRIEQFILIDKRRYMRMKCSECEATKLVAVKSGKCRRCEGLPRRRPIFFTKVIGYKRLKEAESRIADIYIRRTANEVGEELPQVTSTVYHVDLNSEARRLYDKISGGIRDKRKLFTKLVKLRRCCAAPCLAGGEGKDSGKIKELLRLLETELDGQRIVIMTEWREVWIDILKRKLRRWKPLIITGETPQVDREVIRQQFMESEGSNILLMSPVGAYGLNLQQANVMVNLSVPWNPAKLYQRCGRIVRMGSPHPCVRIVTLLARDTVEHRMVEVLSQKQDLFEAIFSTEGLMEATKISNGLTDKQIRGML